MIEIEATQILMGSASGRVTKFSSLKTEMFLTATVWGCLWLLLVTSVHSRPSEESHLEALIESKARKLVEDRQGQALDKTQLPVPEMVEQMALELERAVVGSDKRAEQFQSELAKLVDLSGLMASPPSDLGKVDGDDKRHRMCIAGKQDGFYGRLVDRINSQPQGLLAALSEPAWSPSIVSRPTSMSQNQKAHFIGIGSRHAQLMERARKKTHISYFNQVAQKEAPAGPTPAVDKKLSLVKSFHQKLNWVQRLYVPMVYLKNLPVIGDEMEKYLGIGGSIMEVVTGLSHGIQALIQHWEKNDPSTPVASSKRGLLSGVSCDKLPAEVGGDRGHASVMLSDATVKALESTTSLLIVRYDTTSRLADGQQNELMNRFLGFILGELGRRMRHWVMQG